MTLIDFYHSAADRLAVVARLVAKEAPARTPDPHPHAGRSA